jgi:hypothetical protein
VLTTPTYSIAAKQIADEIAALPGPAGAIAELERVATLPRT